MTWLQSYLSRLISEFRYGRESDISIGVFHQIPPSITVIDFRGFEWIPRDVEFVVPSWSLAVELLSSPYLDCPIVVNEEWHIPQTNGRYTAVEELLLMQNIINRRLRLHSKAYVWGTDGYTLTFTLSNIRVLHRTLPGWLFKALSGLSP